MRSDIWEVWVRHISETEQNTGTKMKLSAFSGCPFSILEQNSSHIGSEQVVWIVKRNPV